MRARAIEAGALALAFASTIAVARLQPLQPRTDRALRLRGGASDRTLRLRGGGATDRALRLRGGGAPPTVTDRAAHLRGGSAPPAANHLLCDGTQTLEVWDRDREERRIAATAAAVAAEDEADDVEPGVLRLLIRAATLAVAFSPAAATFWLAVLVPPFRRRVWYRRPSGKCFLLDAMRVKSTTPAVQRCKIIENGARPGRGRRPPSNAAKSSKPVLVRPNQVDAGTRSSRGASATPARAS